MVVAFLVSYCAQDRVQKTSDIGKHSNTVAYADKDTCQCRVDIVTAQRPGRAAYRQRLTKGFVPGRPADCVQPRLAHQHTQPSRPIASPAPAHILCAVDVGAKFEIVLAYLFLLQSEYFELFLGK